MDWPDADTLRIAESDGALPRPVYRDRSGGLWLLKGENAMAEVGAAKLGKMLGMDVLPAAHYTVGNERGALIPVVKNAKDFGEHWLYRRTWPQAWIEQVFLDIMLSFMIGDNDRHSGNFLVSRGRLHAIDRGYSLTNEDLDHCSPSLMAHALDADDDCPFNRLIKKPEMTLSLQPDFVTHVLDQLAKLEVDDVLQPFDPSIRKKVKDRHKTVRPGVIEFFVDATSRAKSVPAPWQAWLSNPSF